MADEKRGGRRKNKGGSRPPNTKSAAIKKHLLADRSAVPSDVVAALQRDGIRVSSNMVSVVRAKAGVKRARRQANQAANDRDPSAVRRMNQATVLESALLLYNAARGKKISGAEARRSFLTLFAVLS